MKKQVKKLIKRPTLLSYTPEDYRKYICWWAPMGQVDIRWLNDKPPFAKTVCAEASMPVDCDLDEDIDYAQDDYS